MNLLTNRIIFLKTGLLLFAILFFLGCKKAKNELGLNDPNKLPTNTFFTDTLTIKTEVILINDSINTTSVASDTNYYMMTGAYSDPFLGPTAAETYTRLHLVNEHVELPAATADSAYLYLQYNYFYGDSTTAQTINIYKLTDLIKQDTIYYCTSPALNYNPTPIGSVSFQASAGAGSVLKIKITDMTFLQSILNASKNNSDFFTDIPGLAFIPANHTAGAIVRINGSSVQSLFQIYYSQYGTTGNIYNLKFAGTAKKFYRIVTDRSSTALAALQSKYQSINTSSTANLCYIQACAGIRTKITIPYLQNLRTKYPNLAIISAILNVAPKMLTTGQYKTNSGLVLMRTVYDAPNNRYSILKGVNYLPYYVQPDDHSQIANSLVTIAVPDSVTNVYAFSIRSYMQAVLLGQIANNPIIISPSSLNLNVNRMVFNDNSGSNLPTEDKGIKLNLYYSVAK